MNDSVDVTNCNTCTGGKLCEKGPAVLEEVMFAFMSKEEEDEGRRGLEEFVSILLLRCWRMSEWSRVP